MSGKISPAPRTFVAFALAAVALGCGGSDRPEQVEAWGLVTVDGERLPAGAVTFVPAEGTAGPKASARVVDGEYRLPAAAGPVVGAYRVEIVADDPSVPPVDAELSPAELERLAANRPPPPEPLPAVYNTASTLRRELTAGTNRLHFELTRSP